MAHNVSACPKCGYRHEQTNEVHRTCPSCGIIYEKYFARLAALEEKTVELPPTDSTSVTSSTPRLTPAKIIITVIVLVVAVLAIKYVGGGKQKPNAPVSDATEKIIRAFPYDIKGTYTARLTLELTGPNNSKIPEEHEAHLVVNDLRHISEMGLTIGSSYSGPTTMSWSYPDTQKLVSERKADQENQPTTLTVVRSGRALSFDLNEPKGGSMVFDWKDALPTPFEGTDKNGIFEYVKELDALRARVKVIVMPSHELNVPQSAITSFAGSNRWSERCVDPLLRTDGQTVFQDISCRDIAVFTGANVITLKLKHIDVPSVSSLQLTKDSQITFSMGGERNIDVLFFRDGRKKLINREGLRGKSIEFDLVPE